VTAVFCGADGYLGILGMMMLTRVSDALLVHDLKAAATLLVVLLPVLSTE